MTDPIRFVDTLKLINTDITKLTLQSFDDAKLDRPLASIFRFTSMEQLNNLQSQGAGIYWCINPQDNPNERGVKNTMSWTTLGLDVDVAKNGTNVTKEEILERKMEIYELIESLNPTGIIETKNGMQPYWFFEDPVILRTEEERNMANEDYKNLIQGICEETGLISEGDSISRVLRLPGTLHLKTPNEPFTISMAGGTGKLANLSDFRNNYKFEKKISFPIIKPSYTSGQSVYDFDVIKGLTLLSGSDLVNGEVYDFAEERRGKVQIKINDKLSGQWIDIAKNAIGGHPGGEGSFNLVRWVKYYQPEMLDDDIRSRLDVILNIKRSKMPLDIVDSVLDSLDSPITLDESQGVYVKTGFVELDRQTKGLRKGGTYFLGGPQKSGKSSLLMKMVLNMADTGKKIIYIDSELETKPFWERMYAIKSGISIDVAETMKEECERFANEYKQWIYRIPKNSFMLENSISYKMALELSKRKIEKWGCDVLIYDNVTVLGGQENKTGVQGWQVLSAAVVETINLAYSKGVAALLVCHLRDTSVDEIPKKISKLIKDGQAADIFEASVNYLRKPKTSDFFGGGSAHSQLSGVMMLWRPFLNHKQTNDGREKWCRLVLENFRYSQAEKDISMHFDGNKLNFFEVDEIDSTLMDKKMDKKIKNFKPIPATSEDAREEEEFAEVQKMFK